jgi:hypothetical protein
MAEEYEEDVSSDEEEEVDEEFERKEIIRQIEAYHRHFPEILNKKTEKADEAIKSKTAKYSGVTSKDKLKEELETIKKRVSGTTLIKDFGGLFVVGAYAIQDAGTLFGLKLNGPKASLATVVEQNQAMFSSIMKEIACKYDLEKYMEPEMRLGILGIRCIAACHIANTTEEEVRKPVAIAEKQEENKMYQE